MISQSPWHRPTLTLLAALYTGGGDPEAIESNNSNGPLVS